MNSTIAQTSFTASGYDPEFDEEREEQFAAADEGAAVAKVIEEMPWAERLLVPDSEYAGTLLSVWERNPEIYLKTLSADAQSIDDVINALADTAAELRSYRDQGLELELVDGGVVRLIRPDCG